MSNIDYIKAINNAIRDFNNALNDYDTTTIELHQMNEHINELLIALNAYSYEHCKTFYTHYEIIENHRGFTLGVSLLEKGDDI